MAAAQDVTLREWDQTARIVKGRVRQAAAQDEGSLVLNAVLAELENPISDFLNAVVERLIS